MKKILLSVGACLALVLIGCTATPTEATQEESYEKIGSEMIGGVTRPLYINKETNCVYVKSKHFIPAAEQEYVFSKDKCYGHYQNKYGIK